MRIPALILGLVLFAWAGWGEANAPAHSGVAIRDLCRLSAAKENALIGYGLVTGLAGTGDTARNEATMQSIRNALLRFGINVSTRDVRSRNAAAVMVTATLPPYASSGDKLDVTVTSLGDARSLVGGTLLLTHLTGPDNVIYAIAQGAVSVGGFSYELNGNLVQKNHPTTALVSGGGSVERTPQTTLATNGGTVEYVLLEPDFATAAKISDVINQRFGAGAAHAVNPARVRVQVPPAESGNLVRFLGAVDTLTIEPEQRARVVVNERTGTVVSGGEVTIGPVTLAHGDLQVVITTEYGVAQPMVLGHAGPNIGTAIVPDTSVEVHEREPVSLSLPGGSRVVDLVSALNKVKASSRDIITILQGIRRAGALHAELVIQ